MNWPVVAVPSVSYSPETNWSFGAGGSGFFRLPSDSLGRTSEVSFDGAWTLYRQWYVNASAQLYLTDRWQLRAKLSYRHYPDEYYGLGAFPNSESYKLGGHGVTMHLPISYTSKQFSFMAEPLYRASGNNWVGGIFDLRYDAAGVRCPWLYASFGPTYLLDSRDCLYFPRKGLFLKTQAQYASLAFSDCTPGLDALNMGFRFTADFRQFFTLYHSTEEWKELVLAYQLYADVLYPMGSFYAPELMPTLGGQDLLRGFRRGMYRDVAAFAAQAELRIPIWKIFRADVFAGIGDISNFHHWTPPLVGYGLGLRCLFNQAGINLRFDVARNNIDRSWSELSSYSFYFTVKEAF